MEVKRYSIRVNGREIYQYNGIQKALKFYRVLCSALCINDVITVYDRVQLRNLY